MDIFVRSEGCNDPGKAPNTCGIAYIKVNGKDYSLHGRGINVVVVDATIGNKVIRTSVFSSYCEIKEDVRERNSQRRREMLSHVQNELLKNQHYYTEFQFDLETAEEKSHYVDFL